LPQRGVNECIRRSAECILEPAPPSFSLAVGRICLRLVGVEAAQLDPHGDPGRLPVASRIAALSVLIVTFRSRSWQVTSPRTLAIDALQAIRRSRSSSVKLPLRAPRGAPGRAPPGRKYRHHLHVPASTFRTDKSPMLRHLNKDHVVPKPQLFECLYRLMIAALGEAMHGERRLASCPCVGNGLCELAARTVWRPLSR